MLYPDLCIILLRPNLIRLPYEARCYSPYVRVLTKKFTASLYTFVLGDDHWAYIRVSVRHCLKVANQNSAC